MAGEPGPLGTPLRVGQIVSCRPNEGATTPAYVLEVDLGPLGILTSSARLTQRYRAEDLVGLKVVAATGLGMRLIAGVCSEVLVLGVEGRDGDVVLITPDADVPNGGLVH